MEIVIFVLGVLAVFFLLGALIGQDVTLGIVTFALILLIILCVGIVSYDTEPRVKVTEMISSRLNEISFSEPVKITKTSTSYRWSVTWDTISYEVEVRCSK